MLSQEAGSTPLMRLRSRCRSCWSSSGAESESVGESEPMVTAERTLAILRDVRGGVSSSDKAVMLFPWIGLMSDDICGVGNGTGENPRGSLKPCGAFAVLGAESLELGGGDGGTV
jgi:hypothetical protein